MIGLMNFKKLFILFALLLAATANAAWKDSHNVQVKLISVWASDAVGFMTNVT